MQKALLLVLTIIFEPTFLKNSHGFRPNRGCHSALNQVRMEFGSCRWVIESDIRKCFDRIDHEVFINILKRRITCSTTIALINTALKAGYFEEDRFGGKVLANSLGSPQGSVLSPLFSNIILHEFDVEVMRLAREFTTGKDRRISSAWRAVNRKFQKSTPGTPE